MIKLGCIGFGAMGSALVEGFIRTGLLPNQILVYDLSKIACKKAQEVGCQVVHSLTDLEDCDMVLLAIKPQSLDELAKEWPFKEMTVVSILAGISINQLEQSLSTQKVVRVMPNLPAQIGKGVMAVCFSQAISEDIKQTIKDLLRGSGFYWELEEKHFNTVTALSGSSPAFFLLVLEAMVFGGVSEGLNSQIALEMVAHTMIGTAEYLLTENKHPAEIRDLITSPAGTTAAGIMVLEEKGVRAAISSAIKAATQRGKELSEGD